MVRKMCSNLIIFLIVIFSGCSVSENQSSFLETSEYNFVTSDSCELDKKNVIWLDFKKNYYMQEEEAIRLWYQKLELDPNLELFPYEDSILLSKYDINGDHNDEIIACFSGSSFWGRGGSLIVLGFDGKKILWESTVIASMQLDETNIESSLSNKVGILPCADDSMKIFYLDQLWKWEDKVIINNH